MKLLYFTATGNCLSVAKSFGGELLSIPQLIKNGQYELEADKIGIIFPIFHNSVPKLVEEYLDKAKLHSSYIFGIGTYGMFGGNAMKHLKEIGSRNGISFAYLNEVLMVDNYLPGFEMKKQKDGLIKKQVEQQLTIIKKEVAEQKRYFKQKSAVVDLLRKLNVTFYDSEFEKKFSVEESCNGCKTCEKVCPVANIKVDQRPVFQGNCQHCLACIQNCPKSAIHIKGEKSKERFRNEQISLKEIIEANQQ